MQLSVAMVWASSRKQLYMTHSQLSHFHAEKGTLKSEFSKVKSRSGMLRMVKDFLYIFQFSIKRSNIKLKVNLLDNFPRKMFIDTERYLEILLHLIVNAIKFARKVNSYIHVIISCEKITDQAKLKQGWIGFVKTEVFDNGVGIEKEKQEKLFYTFKAQQRDMTHGVGIGLSTVRAVAYALGGEVELKSQIGLGTRIMFTTPISSKMLQKMDQTTLKNQLANSNQSPPVVLEEKQHETPLARY